MSLTIFLPDYGILPSAYFEKSAITNPTELFWSGDLLALLRLCGAREEMIGECASDYDRFLAIVQALPMLEGHPTRAWIASVLEKHFRLRELPNEATASSVWKALCESLLENPIAPQDLVCGAWLCDSLRVPVTLPEQITPVLDANLLLATQTKTAVAWSAEIASVVEHFVNAGCQKIVLHLQRNFEFITPSLYHVNQALQSGKQSRDMANILTCQLVRELCTAAQKHDLLLVLVCEDNASALAHLLEYCEGAVGLSRLCWCAKEAREALPLLEFTAQPHKNEIFAALLYESVMTQNELFVAIEAWQVRYPMGRLCFVTARDLRQTHCAQAHVADMLKKSKTKI